MVKFLVDICDANVNIACEVSHFTQKFILCALIFPVWFLKNGETLLHDQEFPITVESIRYLVETCTINLHAKDIVSGFTVSNYSYLLFCQNNREVVLP